MTREVNAAGFREHLGDLLHQVQHTRDSILIHEDGKPVAALVDAETFARINRMRNRFDQLSERLASAYAEVPEAEGMAEIDAVVAQRRMR